MVAHPSLVMAPLVMFAGSKTNVATSISVWTHGVMGTSSSHVKLQSDGNNSNTTEFAALRFLSASQLGCWDLGDSLPQRCRDSINAAHRSSPRCLHCRVSVSVRGSVRAGACRAAAAAAMQSSKQNNCIERTNSVWCIQKQELYISCCEASQPYHVGSILFFTCTQLKN